MVILDEAKPATMAFTDGEAGDQFTIFEAVEGQFLMEIFDQIGVVGGVEPFPVSKLPEEVRHRMAYEAGQFREGRADGCRWGRWHRKTRWLPPAMEGKYPYMHRKIKYESTTTHRKTRFSGPGCHRRVGALSPWMPVSGMLRALFVSNGCSLCNRHPLG